MSDPAGGAAGRGLRADARRNREVLVDAARDVFAAAGVEAPSRRIAEAAGVGVGTLYRHFPKRSDLVAAVFQRQVDACAEAAPELAAAHAPDVALEAWLHRYARFLAAKRGLASALHSGDPAFAELPDYFSRRLEPALASLLERAAAAGTIRDDTAPTELLRAVALLGHDSVEDAADDSGDGEPREEGPHEGARMVSLLVDGLRHRASSRPV